MPYPEEWVTPMRREVTGLGVQELKTAQDVDEAVKAKGTLLIFVNSICGCAGGIARPALKLALQQPHRPDRMATVFAGQDIEATERARSYFVGHPPSSPSAALLKDGKVVHMIPRGEIEGRDPQSVARVLIAAFDRHCVRANVQGGP
jgi:putative YphP/YqiW family bacilliredoxin